MSLRAVQVYRQLKAVAAFPVQAGPVASSLRYQKKHESICRGELCGSCSGSIQSAGSHETWSLPVLHPSRRPACFISTHVDAGERFVWKPNLQRVLPKREHMGQAHTPYTRSSSSTCAISFHFGQSGTSYRHRGLPWKSSRGHPSCLPSCLYRYHPW